MRIATYNVNGVNGRLPNLLEWLREAAPHIVCLQELKTPDEKFPEAAIHTAGYGAIWRGQKSWNGVALLARGTQPTETRRGLPGDPDDAHSRYIEAAIDGMIVGCLYMPNGNPAPGPKFDYKLHWFGRLAEHAGSLLASGEPVVLAGDYNVMPTDLDVYVSSRGTGCLSPSCRAGLDRRAPGSAPRRANLHVLEIFPERLCSRCRSPHRSSAAQPAIGEASHRGRRGPCGARPRTRERSRTSVDRTCRANEGPTGPGSASQKEGPR
jgi:exodeoxyribonuclease III